MTVELYKLISRGGKKMETHISVTEMIPYSPDELIGKEDFFLNRIKSFISKVRKERADLDNYKLNDVGFVIMDDAVLVKLYFQKDQLPAERENNKLKPDDNKIIDITKYFR